MINTEAGPSEAGPYTTSRHFTDESNNARRTLDHLTYEEQRVVSGRDLDNGSEDKNAQSDESEEDGDEEDHINQDVNIPMDPQSTEVEVEPHLYTDNRTTAANADRFAADARSIEVIDPQSFDPFDDNSITRKLKQPPIVKPIMIGTESPLKQT